MVFKWIDEILVYNEKNRKFEIKIEGLDFSFIMICAIFFKYKILSFF